MHSRITATELNVHLQQIAIASKAYIHPKVLSFATDAQRRNWEKYLPDPADRGTFSNWWRAPSDRTRVGYFSTGVYNWIKFPKKWEEWHCWGAALLNTLPGVEGKTLLIYDCDAHHPDPKVRAWIQLSGLMRTLHTQARGEYTIHSFWYGCGRYPAPVGKGRCVEYTMSWLRDFASQSEGPFLGPDDPRVQGFTQIVLN